MRPTTTTTISAMTPVSFKRSLKALFKVFQALKVVMQNTFSDLFLGDDTADTDSFGKYLVGSLYSCVSH